MRKLLLALALVSTQANAGIGFLVSWYMSGTDIVCEYETDQGVYAIMFNGATVCPQTVFFDEEGDQV